MIYREFTEVTIATGQRCCPEVCGRRAVVHAVVTYLDTTTEYTLCLRHWQTMEQFWGFWGGVMLIDDAAVEVLARMN
jgi:hypothetical protein